MCHAKWTLPRWCAAALWLLAGNAFAQPAGLPGFELERLELNPNGRGSLVMGTGELLPAQSFRVSLAGHYEKNPLVLYADGTPVGAVVSDRVSANLLLAWAPLRWLELGAHLPLVAWQRGDDLSSRSFGSPAPTGLGTPVVQARVALLSQERQAPLDLALELGVGLPLGSVQTLSRDRGARFTPRVLAGRNLGALRVGAQAGVLVRPPLVLIDDGAVQDEVGSEVRLGAVVATTGPGLRGELNVLGALPLTRQARSLEVLAGLRYPVSPHVELYALGGPGFGDTTGTPRFRVLLGVAFGSAPERHPVALASLDDDGDGVKNGEDACPHEAGPEELRGCPAKDTDGDSVADIVDNCPHEKGEVSNQGCPAQQEQLVVIQKNELKVKQSVYFDTGEAIIQQRSFELLDQLARVLGQHPEIAALNIEGHSDSQGNADTNRKLSLARAESVKRYLVSKGVEASRLRAQGFGPDRPIASNATAEGRAANRRVVFSIVNPDSLP